MKTRVGIGGGSGDERRGKDKQRSKKENLRAKTTMNTHEKEE